MIIIKYRVMINFKSFYKFEAFKFRSGVCLFSIFFLGMVNKYVVHVFQRKWQYIFSESNQFFENVTFFKYFYNLSIQICYLKDRRAFLFKVKDDFSFRVIL